MVHFQVFQKGGVTVKGLTSDLSRFCILEMHFNSNQMYLFFRTHK